MTIPSKQVRVHKDFAEVLQEMAKEANTTLTNTSRELAKLLQEKRMKKKGQISSMMYIGVTLFMLSVMIIVGYFMAGEINTVITNSPAVFEAPAAGIYESYYSGYVTVFDGVFLFLVIGLVIATVVSAFFIRSHPIFFAASTLLLIIFGVVWAVLGQAFTEMTTNTTLSAATSNFTIIPYIMDNFVIYLVILSFAVLAVLFAKNYQGGL